MTSSPARGALQVPIDQTAAKPFDLHKYKAVATSLLRSAGGRVDDPRKFNQTVSACNVPPAILQRIFIACTSAFVHDSKWSWVLLTYVCSTWRQAALDCSELWSYLDFSHPKWTTICLRRTQRLPISIQAVVDVTNQRFIQRAIHYAPMIRHIHLISSLSCIGPLVGTLKEPNRYLKSLIIDVSQPEDNQSIQYSKSSKSLFPSGGPSLPSLRYLELHRAPMSLLSSRYTNLRCLSLHHIPSSQRPSCQEFFSLLAGFVTLEHLTLVRAFPKAIAGARRGGFSGRNVLLPMLQSISLSGSIPDITRVLESMVYRPATRVYCYIDSLADFKDEFWTLAEVIGAHSHEAACTIPLGSLTITGLEDSLRYTEERTFNPKFRQSLRIRAFEFADIGEPRLDLVVGPDAHTTNDEVLVSALRTILDFLPLTDVHTLSLNNLDVVTQKTWPRLSYLLPSLRVLNISGHPPSGLLWTLLLNARSYSHLEYDDMSSMLLPTLEDIYLHNIDCFAGGLMVSPSGPVNSHYDLDDSRFLDVLLTYLEDRKRCNLALRSVSISRCSNVSMKVLDTMKDFVSHVLWDHRGLKKEEGMKSEPDMSAVYRSHWISTIPARQHYFRLKTLLELDS